MRAEPGRRDRVIAPVRVMRAGRALFLDVGNLAVRGDFAVPTGDAAAGERREPEETNKTHHANPRLDIEQFLYRRGYVAPRQ